jgi:hypothetical protein
MSWRKAIANDLLVVGSYLLPFAAPGDERAQEFMLTSQEILNPGTSDARVGYLLSRAQQVYGDYVTPLLERFAAATRSTGLYDNS